MTLEKPTDAQLTTKFHHFTQMKIHYHIDTKPPRDTHPEQTCIQSATLP